MPLYNQGLCGYGFRLIWRVLGDMQETAWSEIVARRMEADNFIAKQSEFSMFISSITGVFTKPSMKGQVPQNVFPTLAYWVVTGQNYDVRHILAKLCTAFAGVEVREVGSGMNTLNRMASSLYPVLKDHNNSYILKRNMASLQHVGIKADSNQMPPSKLVVLNPGFQNFLENIVAELHKVRFDLCVEVRKCK